MDLILPDVVNEIPELPDLIVTFTGLMPLQFIEGGGCEAGALPQNNHKLEIKLEIRSRNNDKIPNRNSGKILREYLYKGDFSGRFNIDVKQSKPTLTRYEQPGNLVRPALTRLQKETSLTRDFRWILNLQPFHETRLKINQAMYRPLISLNGGLFYTYKLFMPHDHDDPLRELLLVRKRKFPKDSPLYHELGIHSENSDKRGQLKLRTVAEVIGANIYLGEQGSSVALSWGQNFSLELTRQPNAYAVLSFRNMDERPPRPTRNNQSDLPLYYGDDRILSPAEEQLDLSYQHNGANDDHPCIPVIPGS